MSKILNFFISYKIKYFKSNVIDTTLSYKYHNKIQMISKNVMLVTGQDKSQLQLIT